jgi:hypothetical protein
MQGNVARVNRPKSMDQSCFPCTFLSFEIFLESCDRLRRIGFSYLQKMERALQTAAG